MPENIPYLDLSPQYQALKKAIDARIQTVLNHGQFILGPEVVECEKALASYVGAKHCLTAASGTDALMMILMALDIKAGDEVITTPFSFFATAEVISLVGAEPVFVDIDSVTYNLDAKKIEAAITKKTKAIMPVSLYGQPADFDDINAIGKKYSLPIIEDAAQSFAAAYQSKAKGKTVRSGHLGDVGATSFFPAKPLGCYGDGGAIFTDNSDLALKLEQIRVHGQSSRYHHVMMGINGRLDTLQCAVLLEKLKRYDWEIDRRQQIAMKYSESFSDLAGKLIVPKVLADRSSVWAQYTVCVKDRNQFAAKLKEKGIPTSIHYPSPLHHQPVYAHLRDRYHLPVSEKVANEVISLPMFPDLKDEHQTRVIEAVRDVLR